MRQAAFLVSWQRRHLNDIFLADERAVQSLVGTGVW